MKLFLLLISLVSLFVNTNCEWEIKGMTFTNGKYCPEVPYGSEAAHYSMKLLESTGTNYVALVVTEY